MITGSFNAQRANGLIARVLDVFVERTSSNMLVAVRKYTPKRSGLARRSWNKTKSSKLNYKVTNKQPYVDRLNKGYSKQAPKGFFQPAVRDVLRTNKGRFAK